MTKQRMHRSTIAKLIHSHCKLCKARLEQPIHGRFKEFCDDYCRKTYNRVLNSWRSLEYARRLVARRRAFRPQDRTDEKPQDIRKTI